MTVSGKFGNTLFTRKRFAAHVKFLVKILMWHLYRRSASLCIIDSKKKKVGSTRVSLSTGKVSSDVCTRHVYPITTCVMTPVSDLVMLFLFFFRGEGAEMYD